MNSEKFLSKKNLKRKIENIKSKRRWKAVNKQLDQLDEKEEEQEEEEQEEEEEEIGDSKFYKKFSKQQKKYEHKLRSRFDEFGTEFTPFNMREEQADGKFDDTGYFVFNKKEEYDPWYESVKEEVEKKEKEDKNKQNDKQSEKDDEEYAYYGEEDLYYKEEKVEANELKQIQDDIKKYRIMLLDFLNRDETVQKAIQRLKPKTEPKRNLKKVIKASEDVSSSDNKIEFDKLLEIVSNLLELSHFDVYSDSFEKILTKYGKYEVLVWKYRTIEKNTQEVVEYGPFTTKEIAEWIKQDLLKNTEEMSFELQVRNLGEELNEEWLKVDDNIITNIINEYQVINEK